MLRGSIGSNVKWLRLAQNAIDTSKHRQEVAFVVETAGLKLGSTHTGTIAIDSNGGAQQVKVLVSMEVTDRVIERFRRMVVPIGIFAADLFGTLLGIHPVWSALWAMASGGLLAFGARTLFHVLRKQRVVSDLAYLVGVSLLLPVVLGLLFVPPISAIIARLPFFK